MKKAYKWIALLSALAFAAIFGGCKSKEASCSCGCKYCVCSRSSEYLFAFPKHGLRQVDLEVDGDIVYLLDDIGMEEALDVLNSFIPKGKPDPVDEPREGSVQVRIIYYNEMVRYLYLEGDTITIGSKRYTGEEGSLEPLYDKLK